MPALSFPFFASRHAFREQVEASGATTWGTLLAAQLGNMPKTQVIALMAGMLLCGTVQVRADFTVAEFQANVKSAEATSYLQGLLDGIEITNALAQTRRPVFCSPASFVSVESFREFLARYIQANTSGSEVSIASVATSALMAEYPCPGP